jgi:hypothetical protein
MRVLFKGIHGSARVIRRVGSFCVNVVIPWFGIPRPWNYLAAGFLVVWTASIGYAIATR